MNRNLDEAHRSKRTMQVVFPTAALARGLRFDQWRGSVLLLLSHWRVWIGAPGEEQAFHGDGTSENLGLGLQTRRGAGGGRISSESTAPVHEWCLACVSFRTPTTLVRLRFGALIPMTRLFTLILARALAFALVAAPCVYAKFGTSVLGAAVAPERTQSARDTAEAELRAAASRGDLAEVERMLKTGADVNAKTRAA